MNTISKFRCTEVRKTISVGSWGPAKLADAVYVTFNAVMGKENEAWSKFTPSGQLTMLITNPDLLDAFEVGKDYYLTVSPVELAN
jgi:hypothetical protein